MTVINTNVKSLQAQNAITFNNRSMSAAMQQLSSGSRINSAKDDAAGLAISDKMTAQIRGLNQAVRNANDGISLLQTAEGAMVEITNMMQRMRELAIQSANDTNAQDDRNYLDLEFQQLKQEINRITKNTQWNGMNILDQTEPASGARGGTFTFQVGANTGDSHKITHTLDKLAFGQAAGTAVFGAATIVSGVQTSAVTFAGAYKEGDIVTLTVDNRQMQYTVTKEDAQASNVANAVAKSVANTFGAVPSAAAVTQVAQVDTITLTGPFVANDTIDLVFNGAPIRYTVTAGDIDANNAATTLGNVRTGVIAAINLVTTSTATAAAGTAAGAITLTAATAGAAFTATTNDVQVSIAATTANRPASTAVNAVTGKFNGLNVTVTGAAVSFVGAKDQTFEAFAKATDGKLATVEALTITSQSNSDTAIAGLDQAMVKVNEARAEIGAVINRLTYAADNLANVSMNTSESRSRILDTDYAKASAELARTQIISQAATAMLAQANQQPQAVLQLLQG
jgi:flagellin